MSAFGGKADINSWQSDVCFWHKADIRGPHTFRGDFGSREAQHTPPTRLVRSLFLWE
jgi:hypothetical protein